MSLQKKPASNLWASAPKFGKKKYIGGIEMEELIIKKLSKVDRPVEFTEFFAMVLCVKKAARKQYERIFMDLVQRRIILSIKQDRIRYQRSGGQTREIKETATVYWLRKDYKSGEGNYNG